MHQFGTKVFPEIFMGHPLNTGRGWTGDLLIVDTEDLKTMPPSEIHIEIFKAQEVDLLKRNSEFVFTTLNERNLSRRTALGHRCVQCAGVPRRESQQHSSEEKEEARDRSPDLEVQPNF